MARFLELETVLGNTDIVLASLSGREELGGVSSYRLALVSRLPDITADQLLGTNATIGLEQGDGKRRFINGYITAFAELGQTASSYFDQGGRGVAFRYDVELHTWPWLSSRRTNCRIFQDKTIIEILAELFQPYLFARIDSARVTGRYKRWTYCVQYRESDYDFLNRLCEHEGLTYYFRHENGRHTLVLADAASAYDPAPGYAQLSFNDSEKLVPTGTDAWIRRFKSRHEVSSGKVVLGDYNPEKPRIDLTTRAGTPGKYKFGDFEVYDYPGIYQEPGDGEAYVRRRAEMLKAREARFVALTNARGLVAGHRLAMVDHPKHDFNTTYLITAVAFTATNPAPSSGGEAAQYEAELECLVLEVPFRPERRTPKPVMRGPQTAVVVGPSGEHIHTDKLGRVKVQFHWDRYGAADDKSSCWLRVAQGAAGKKWGMFQLPRVGHEVVVEFLEGDPDQPLVTGAVYNGENTPPYNLPAEKTRSGWRSNTYQGDGFNEITFDDKAGAELFFQHAQRDHETRIKNDRREQVGGQSQFTVDKSAYDHVGENWHVTVDKERRTKIGADEHLDVVGDANVRVGGGYSLLSTDDIQVKTNANGVMEAGTAFHVKAGMSIAIEAGTSISLKVGGSFVSITPAGVFIKGPMVNIQTGGSAASAKSANPDAPKAPEAKTVKETKGGQASSSSAKPIKPATLGSQATALRLAAASRAPLCEVCK